LFEVAYQLKTPVYLLSEMPYDELLDWIAYFEKRPVGWQDDDRTFKLLQAQGVKAQPGEIFTSLKKVYASTPQIGDNGQVLGDLSNSGLFSKMMGAIGGDKLEF
jgi:hypothetical protein